MSKKVFGRPVPQYIPSKAIPELQVGSLIVPCHRVLKNGDIIVEREIRFKVYPCSGADAKTCEECLYYFRQTIEMLQAIMNSDKYPLEKKDQHAENYVKAFDIVVTQQNRPDLVGKLNKMLSINTKHIQRRYERASTSVKQ